MAGIYPATGEPKAPFYPDRANLCAGFLDFPRPIFCRKWLEMIEPQIKPGLGQGDTQADMMVGCLQQWGGVAWSRIIAMQLGIG